jgi:hypothetical protein
MCNMIMVVLLPWSSNIGRFACTIRLLSLCVLRHLDNAHTQNRCPDRWEYRTWADWQAQGMIRPPDD